MDHLTRYAMNVRVPDKAADSVACVLLDPIIGLFDPPDMLCSDPRHGVREKSHLPVADNSR